MKRFSLILTILLFSASAQAGMCTATVHRVCNPQKPCQTSETHSELTPSAEHCLAYAKRLCPVYFTEGVASKQVQASFDGQPIQGGQNLCQ